MSFVGKGTFGALKYIWQLFEDFFDILLEYVTYWCHLQMVVLCKSVACQTDIQMWLSTDDSVSWISGCDILHLHQLCSYGACFFVWGVYHLLFALCILLLLVPGWDLWDPDIGILCSLVRELWLSCCTIWPFQSTSQWVPEFGVLAVFPGLFFKWLL